MGALSHPKKGNVNSAKKMSQHDRHYLTGRIPSNLLNVQVLASNTYRGACLPHTRHLAPPTTSCGNSLTLVE